jgi:hypothetical protein
MFNDSRFARCLVVLTKKDGVFPQEFLWNLSSLGGRYRLKKGIQHRQHL